MSKKVSATHKAIFNYWKNKGMSKNGHILDAGETGGIDIIQDWDIPCCWACGYVGWDYENDPEYQKLLEDKKYADIWNLPKVKSNLNRCHIIPNMLEGKCSPENLFLLCEYCHNEAPDTTDPKMFMSWFYKYRMNGGYLGAIASQVVDSLINDFELDVTKIKIPNSNKYQSKIGQHSGRVKMSSIVASIVSNIIDEQKR